MALPSSPVAHSIVRKEVPLPNKDSQDTRRSDLELGEGDTSSTAELLPTDRGAAAWKVLLGAFVFEAILWGLPLSYGVFQDYYSNIEPFRGNKSLPVVGTLGTSLMFLGGPILTPIVKRFQRYQRHLIFAGWLICVISLVAASFATTTTQLILTQGALYGFGVLIFYYPILSMLNEWFVQKRGLAYGVMNCATGFSGTVFPFALEKLLQKYGYAITLRGMALFIAALIGPLVLVFKGRAPLTKEKPTLMPDLSFFKKPRFYLYAASNLFHGMGFYFPLLFLPSYATAVGLSVENGAMLLAIVSLAQAAGQLSFGYLSDDRLHLHLLTFMSPFVSAVACFTFWGFSHTLAPLIVFSLIYGFFAAGYVVLWARMGMQINEDPKEALTSWTFLAFEKGVGNVLTGPISAALISQSVTVSSYGIARYKNIVLFAGACMLLSSLVVAFWHLNPRRTWSRLSEKS